MIPVPVTLSPSKMTSFADCPYAFKLKYIDKMPEPEADYLLKGTVVHRALEYFYQLHPPQRSGLTLSRIVEAALEDLAPEAGPDFRKDCYQLASNIFLVEDPRNIRVRHTEFMVEADVDGHVHRGIIDRVDYTEAGAVIVDYKTGKVPDAAKQRSKAQGIMFYALAWKELTGEAPAKVRLVYLAGPTVLSFTPSPAKMNALRGKMRAMWDAIELACEKEDFRPRRGPLCNWCTFQALCPEFA